MERHFRVWGTHNTELLVLLVVFDILSGCLNLHLQSTKCIVSYSWKPPQYSHKYSWAEWSLLGDVSSQMAEVMAGLGRVAW